MGTLKDAALRFRWTDQFRFDRFRSISPVPIITVTTGLAIG